MNGLVFTHFYSVVCRWDVDPSELTAGVAGAPAAFVHRLATYRRRPLMHAGQELPDGNQCRMSSG